MATQAIAGYNAQVLIDTSATVTPNFVQIGEMKDCTLKIQAAEIDVTSHNFSGWQASIPGAKKWSVDADALYLTADTVQDKLFDALVNSVIVKLKFRPKAGATIPEWSGDAYVISWELSGPTSDAAAVKISMSGAGPLTKATQP